MTTYLGALILAAMASPLAVIYGGRWFDRWLGRQMDFELPPESADVIDGFSLPVLSDSPLFWATVADMPFAGELAVRFAAEVEAFVAEEAS